MRSSIGTLTRNDSHPSSYSRCATFILSAAILIADSRNQVCQYRATQSPRAAITSATGDASERRRQALLDNVEDVDNVSCPQQPVQPPSDAPQPAQPTPDAPPVDPRARVQPLANDPTPSANGNPPPGATSQDRSTPQRTEAAGWGIDAVNDDGWGGAQAEDAPPPWGTWGNAVGGDANQPRSSARAFARTVLGAFVGGGDEPASGPRADVVPLTEDEEV